MDMSCLIDVVNFWITHPSVPVCTNIFNLYGQTQQLFPAPCFIIVLRRVSALQGGHHQAGVPQL
jgi:hypothetical protein